MTDAEKDDHISKLEREVGELKVQMRALYGIFLDVDPTDPEAGTKAKRIMDVVKAVERSNWAFRMVVRIFLLAGGIATAALAIKGFIK